MIGMKVELHSQNEAKDRFREAMPVCREYAYFDHAAVGPIPLESAKAIREWTDQALYHGDIHWPKWAGLATELRGNAARLIHCSQEEIGLIPNTTFGINVIANGFRWDRCGVKRPSVVVPENEFASNLLPWLALEQKGVEVRRVRVSPSGELSLDALRAAIDQSTQLVSVSWVGYFSGYRIDLARLCALVHEAGAQLFVDAIQGLGAFPLDVSEIPIDYLAADGHKWMLGPEGAGFMFIRKSNLDRLEPLMQGWSSLQMAHQFDAKDAKLKNNASRFEGGSANHVGQIGLAKSIALLNELGSSQPRNAIESSILENANRIEEGLKLLGAEVFRAGSEDANRSGILTFQLVGQDPNRLRNSLVEEKVVLSVRHGRLRVATHAYNDASDIERLLAAIRRAASN
jgi:cysteine desulfurase / selenocysteine lyase